MIMDLLLMLLNKMRPLDEKKKTLLDFLFCFQQGDLYVRIVLIGVQSSSIPCDFSSITIRMCTYLKYLRFAVRNKASCNVPTVFIYYKAVGLKARMLDNQLVLLASPKNM